MQAFISYAEKNKFDGIFAASSTGGFASLSFEQHREFRRIRDTSNIQGVDPKDLRMREKELQRLEIRQQTTVLHS